jgi:hypothetical protein
MTTRALAVLALFGAVVAAATAADVAAQGSKTPATKTAPPATKQGVATKQAPTTKTATPQTKGAAGRPQRRPALAVAPEAAPARPTIMYREAYEYESGGRRDPFMTLLTSAELRPTIADLKLVIILADESGRRPVAVMRDLTTNTQYRVTTGMTLGRMRVTAIRRKVIVFTIEEFGLNRQDSLILGDTTTRARAR